MTSKLFSFLNYLNRGILLCMILIIMGDALCIHKQAQGIALIFSCILALIIRWLFAFGRYRRTLGITNKTSQLKIELLLCIVFITFTLIISGGLYGIIDRIRRENFAVFG